MNSQITTDTVSYSTFVAIFFARSLTNKKNFIIKEKETRVNEIEMNV